MRSKRFLRTVAFILLFAASCSSLPTALPVETPDPHFAVAGSWWQPQKGLSWRIQYQGGFSPEPDAAVGVYNLDLFGTSAETVAQLHEQGAKVVCYISVGTLEDWTPDVDEFPSELLGLPYKEWPGETWLDLRQLNKLMPLIEARLDLCRQKGFDGVDPDNLDSWTHETGFDLTKSDTITFARALSEAAHTRGLAIGLKNCPELVNDLISEFDFMVAEEAFEQGWWKDALPFLQANKPVFAIEYSNLSSVRDEACRGQREQGFSVLFAGVMLDAKAKPCP